MEQSLGKTSVFLLYKVIQALGKELHLLKIIQTILLHDEDVNHILKVGRSLNVRKELKVSYNFMTFNNRFEDFTHVKVSVLHL